MVIGALGCSDDRVLLPGAASSTGESSSGSTTTSGSSSTSSTSTGLADDTTGTTGLASTGEPAVIFVPELDAGHDDFECDPFTQDCPPGQKCLPWGNDGGSWNATRCSPVADDPAAVGEPCHVEGSYYSGIDDCELGAMCWDVDPETNEGVCFAQCVGSLDDVEVLICEDPDHQCVLWSTTWEAGLALCHPVCDPLLQDCPADQACYPQEHSGGWDWFCGNDASGDAGAYGDLCEYVNVCAPGLVCQEGTVPGCEGVWGCCTEVCDLSDPLGDAQCSGAAEGQQCLPWYEDDDTPPGYEDVGVCTLPT